MMFWQGNLPVLAHIQEACAALREKLIKLQLVKWIINVLAINPRIWLPHCDTTFSVVEKVFPSGVAHLVFHWKIKEETYKNGWRKIISNKNENYKNSLPRFLEKYNCRNLVSMRPLYFFDHTSNRVLESTTWEFLLAWFRKFLESGRLEF